VVKIDVKVEVVAVVTVLWNEVEANKTAEMMMAATIMVTAVHL
jgi:hypothetical protein